MLRRSTAPLAICVFILASCAESTDSPLPASAETPPVGGLADIADLTLTFEQNGGDGTQKSSYSSTLAKIPENQDWSITIRAANGQGGFVSLKLGDAGNGDSDAFEFDTETGLLRVREPLNFEQPLDDDEDNTYDMLMIAHEYPGAPSLPFSIEVTDLGEIFSTTDIIRIDGYTPYGGLGRNAANLGDINGDGAPDLMVAAPGLHSRDASKVFPLPAGSQIGDVFIISGQALSEIDTQDLKTDAGSGVLKLEGTSGDENFGYSWAVLGDLDADGINDFATARNQTQLNIISGAVLANAMEEGGTLSLDEIDHVTVTLPDNYFINPHNLGAMGDMNGDNAPELAVCMRRGDINATTSFLHNVVLVSGAPLKEALATSATVAMNDLIRAGEAGGYYRYGRAGYCGPLTVMGDVNGDGLKDVAVGIIDPDENSATVYSGAKLLESWSFKALRIAYYSFFLPPANSTFTDRDVPTIGGTHPRIITPLGDINDDEIDDFAFGWKYYLDSTNPDLDSAFVVKGHSSIFDANGINTNKDMRDLHRRGDAILLDGPSGADQKLTALSAILPPENGKHETLLTARLGFTTTDRTVHSVLADELPDGGTPSIEVPIEGMGSLSIPSGRVYNFSQMISIGDLNEDGYGDLFIGFDTATAGFSKEAGYGYLVSGKSILDKRSLGVEYNPLVEHEAQ